MKTTPFEMVFIIREKRRKGIDSSLDLRRGNSASSTTQRCGTLRHTAYWQCQSGHLLQMRCGTVENAGGASASMLNDFTGADKVYIACGYTDLRKGIDGLARLVQQQFKLDPFMQQRKESALNDRALLAQRGSEKNCCDWLEKPCESAAGHEIPRLMTLENREKPDKLQMEYQGASMALPVHEF